MSTTINKEEIQKFSNLANEWLGCEWQIQTITHV